MVLKSPRGESLLNAVKHEPDERLLVAAAVADPRQFATLYERHLAAVYGYVSRRVHSRAEAEDVTSEVFHRALAALPQYESRGAPFAAWLFRIAANCLADRWQKAAREKGQPSPGEPAVAPVDLEAAARTDRLFALLGKLPEDQQRVVRMRFLEEKSVKEISAAMGRSEGAVKQLQYRALEWLRGQMSEENG